MPGPQWTASERPKRLNCRAGVLRSPRPMTTARRRSSRTSAATRSPERPPCGHAVSHNYPALPHDDLTRLNEKRGYAHPDATTHEIMTKLAPHIRSEPSHGVLPAAARPAGNRRTAAPHPPRGPRRVGGRVDASTVVDPPWTVANLARVCRTQIDRRLCWAARLRRRDPGGRPPWTRTGRTAGWVAWAWHRGPAGAGGVSTSVKRGAARTEPGREAAVRQRGGPWYIGWSPT
jgi:hypothetical protein